MAFPQWMLVKSSWRHISIWCLLMMMIPGCCRLQFVSFLQRLLGCIWFLFSQLLDMVTCYFCVCWELCPPPQPSLKVVVTTQVRLPVVYIIFYSVILNGGNGHWVHIVVAWLHAQALRAGICIKWLFGAQPFSAFGPFDGPMSFPWGTLSARHKLTKSHAKNIMD